MELVTIKDEKYIKVGDLKIIVKTDSLAENPLILNDVNFVSCNRKYSSIGNGEDYDKSAGRLSVKQIIKKIEKDGYKTAKIYAYFHTGISLYVVSSQSLCPLDSCLLGIVFHKKNYTDAWLENIILEWECLLNNCIYFIEVINSITQEQEDIIVDLYGEYEAQNVLKRYFGVNLNSQELLKII